MKIVAIITEYNPLHNGHKYQIDKVRDIFGKDTAIIAIMSGNFVQRGEPAILNKWDRARIAKSCGINLILELPTIFATSSAGMFARGGVSTAAATGICDYLVFGSELGSLDALNDIAHVVNKEPEDYVNYLHQELKSGKSFAASRSEAICKYLDYPEATDILKLSNNILGIEYLSALRIFNEIYSTNIKPYTIKREGSNYCDTILQNGIHPSATAIRQYIATSNPTSAELIKTLKNSMPAISLSILTTAARNNHIISTPEILANNILTKLLTTAGADIQKHFGMNEGIPSRLINISRRLSNSQHLLEQLVSQANSKRYPSSRIRRALNHFLLGITTESVETADTKAAPHYIRVLDFDKTGRYLLKHMRNKAKVPIITRASDFHEFSNQTKNKQINTLSAIDLLASDIWEIHAGGTPGTDFVHTPGTLGTPGALGTDLIHRPSDLIHRPSHKSPKD